MKIKKKTSKWLNLLAPFIMLILCFAAIEAVVRVFNIPGYVMSPPTKSFKYFAEHYREALTNCAITLKSYLIGYPMGALLGIVLAFLFSSNKVVQKAFSPYLTVISCVPMLILSPLFKIWFGLGRIVNVLICLLSCFSTVCTNTMLGVKAVPEERIELVKTCKGSKLQTFVRIIIPSSLPHVFTGLKLGSIFALSGIIGSEMVGSMDGVGFTIVYTAAFVQMDILFAHVYLLMLFGFIFYSIISAVENKVVHQE